MQDDEDYATCAELQKKIKAPAPAGPTRSEDEWYTLIEGYEYLDSDDDEDAASFAE